MADGFSKEHSLTDRARCQWRKNKIIFNCILKTVTYNYGTYSQGGHTFQHPIKLKLPKSVMKLKIWTLKIPHPRISSSATPSGSATLRPGSLGPLSERFRASYTVCPGLEPKQHWSISSSQTIGLACHVRPSQQASSTLQRAGSSSSRPTAPLTYTATGSSLSHPVFTSEISSPLLLCHR